MRIFVPSLSANSDLIGQWRAYAADGEGFAVGLEGKVLRDRSGFGEHTLSSCRASECDSVFLILVNRLSFAVLIRHS